MILVMACSTPFSLSGPALGTAKPVSASDVGLPLPLPRVEDVVSEIQAEDAHLSYNRLAEPDGVRRELSIAGYEGDWQVGNVLWKLRCYGTGHRP